MPPLPEMVSQVQQTLDVLYWALSRVLSDEGITVLHWAILKRAYRLRGGVPFRQVMQATGQSKDDVRRAAGYLQTSELGEVIADPEDRRARIFRLTRRGRNRTRYLEENFQANLLVMLGANRVESERVKRFTRDLLNAARFLPPGDLADTNSYRSSDTPDDTRDDQPAPKHLKQAPLWEPGELPF